MSRTRRRGRRGKWSLAVSAEALEARALQAKLDESRAKHRRQGEALTPDQQNLIHHWIATAKLTGQDVLPFVRYQWKETYGEEIRRGVEVYYCHSPLQAARRLAKLEELAEHPDAVCLLNFPFFALKLQEGYENLSKPTLRDVKWQRVLGENGEWRDERVDIYNDREPLRRGLLTVHAKVIEARAKLAEQRRALAQAKADGPTRNGLKLVDGERGSAGGYGKARPLHGEGMVDDGDIEDQRVPSEVARALVEQEGVPFAPMADAHSAVFHEEHAKLVKRRLKAQAGMPDEAFGRPTRIVKENGDIVILDTDAELPDGPAGPDKPAVKAEVVVDESSLLLASEAEIAKDFKADEGPEEKK